MISKVVFALKSRFSLLDIVVVVVGVQLAGEVQQRDRAGPVSRGRTHHHTEKGKQKFVEKTIVKKIYIFYLFFKQQLGVHERKNVKKRER